MYLCKRYILLLEVYGCFNDMYFNVELYMIYMFKNF